MSMCAYRPPWPDEMERYAVLLEHDRVASSFRRPRIWETSSPCRFAGAAVWCPPEDEKPAGTVEVRFRFRPKFNDPLFASELLRDLFNEIAAAGYRRVNLLLPTREPWAEVLAHFGLSWGGMNECWMADGLEGHERVRAAEERWMARLPEGWVARKIEESDKAFVMEASGAAGFFEGDNLQRVWKNRSTDLSCVIQTPGRPAGVLLATRFGMMAVVEFMGTAPEFRRQSALISFLALRFFSRRDHIQTFDRYITFVNPAKGSASGMMMRRFGGHIAQSYHQFGGEIQLPNF